MQANITKIIDQYLLGELTPSDKLAFEERLATNSGLRDEVNLQQNIHEAAHRASMRMDIQHIARRYRLNRIIRWGAAGIGIIAIVVASTLLIQSNFNKNTPQENEIAIVDAEVAEKLNEFVQFDNVPVQYFSIPTEGDVKLSEEGVLLSIPKEAFLLNGAPYSGPSIVQYQEALDAATIIKGGLNTMAGDKLLETQGMFSVQAYTPEGEKLEVNPAVGVYIQVPVDECKTGMQLFEGVQKSDGTMDWQNPVPLEKIPMSVEMTDLNFYPQGYESKLNALKWKKSKKSRDSLYLSFEEIGNSSNNIIPISGNPINVGMNEGIIVTSPDGTVTQITTPQPNIVFFPELEAEFPGGMIAMKAYIIKNTKYPQYAIIQGLSGVVYVAFSTDSEGNIEDANVEKSVHPLLDKEAIRVINNMPNWVPAGNNNTMPTRALHRVPITFALNGDAKTNDPYDALYVGVTSYVETETPQVVNNYGMWTTDAGADSEPADTLGRTGRYPFVSPSKVLALWKPKFNNTNLATREFERRMKAIHSTCNDVVIEKYTRQLSKPISQIDSEVAAMGYGAFNAFAAEQIGAVNPNNPHLKNLQKFYDEGIIALKKEAKKSRDWEQKLRTQRDAEISNQRKKHAGTTKKNKENSERDEKSINTRKALVKTRLHGPSRTVRQVPNYRPSTAAILPQFTSRTASFTVRRSGSYNLDRYRTMSALAQIRRTLSGEPKRVQEPIVLTSEERIALEEKRRQKLNNQGKERQKVQEQLNARYEERLAREQAKQRIKNIASNATKKRKTVTIIENGRSTTITYNEFSLEVPNAEKYVKLFGYLFPNKMNSFQLIDLKEGKFEYNLNSDIIYDVCVVGITEDGYEYFQKQTLNGGDLGRIKLERLTELDLEESIRQLNKKRISRPAPILGELDWVRAETNNYREQKRRQSMIVFRKGIEEVIFPCYSGNNSEELIELEGNVPDAPKEENSQYKTALIQVKPEEE